MTQAALAQVFGLRPYSSQPKSKHGLHAACKYCQQDIEFTGKSTGWRDRGSNRACVPFVKNGEVVKPKTKHSPAV